MHLSMKEMVAQEMQLHMNTERKKTHHLSFIIKLQSALKRNEKDV